MSADFVSVFLIVSLFVAVVLLELIRSHVSQAVRELKQLTAAVNQLKGSFPGLTSVIRSQEETIKSARAREESKMGRALLDDDRKS